MITVDRAMEFVEDFGGLREFPREGRHQLLIAEALAQVCRDETAAQAICMYWLEHAQFAPTPADIFETAVRIRRPELEEDMGCPKCEGTGYRRVFLSRKHVGNGKFEEREIDYAEYLEKRLANDPDDEHVSDGVKVCECRHSIAAKMPATEKVDSKARASGE